MRFHFHGRRHGRPDPTSPMQFGGRDWSFPFGNIHFEPGGEGPRGGGWGGHGPRGRKRRMFSSEEFQLIILKLIADEPRHGYAIIKALEEMTHGDYAPSAGILYTNLELLEDMGLIERQANAGANKKSFAITDEGRAHLAERESEVTALFERLEASGEGRRRSSRPELGRAVGNLMNALGNRAAQHGWNEDLLNEVIDILDDAARRIERAK